MASLTLTIGQLEANVSADNTKASALLLQYAVAIGAEGTNQEKANAVLAALVRHMQDEARRVRNNIAAVEAMANIQAELNALAWE